MSHFERAVIIEDRGSSRLQHLPPHKRDIPAVTAMSDELSGASKVV
jgi:hypothetical protein